MREWGQTYVDEIRTRVIARAIEIPDQLQAITAGRTMPDFSDLRIGSGKQTELAILFIDISDFSSRPSSNYEEQKWVLFMLNAFIPEMMATMREWGGKLEKNTGDGIMAYFGTETTNSEQMAKEAVGAALAMHYVTDKFINPVLFVSGVDPVKFRVTIDQGPVTLARIGIPGLSERITAIGSAANIANKLLDIAKPGELYIGNNVYRALPDSWKLVEFDAPGTIRLGYQYVLTGLPYFAWKYTGVWRDPQ